jgi:phage recombination protein Bet
MANNAVARYDAGTVVQPFEITNEQVDLIRNSILRGSNDLELALFINWCRDKRLNPLSQEAYAVRQGGALQPAATIHGMRKIASRSGVYGPQDGPYWCGRDGQWTDVWLQDEPPLAAKVGVKRIGADAFTYSVAHWKEYGAGKAGRGGPWATQPAHMLAIRAEADALRRVFPDDLSGVYTREELGDEPPAPNKPQPVAARLVISGDRLESAHLESEDGEIIDAETGEIETLESVMAEVKALAGGLKLDGKAVQGLAKSLRADYTTIEGAVELRSSLLGMVPEAEQDAGRWRD